MKYNTVYVRECLFTNILTSVYLVFSLKSASFRLKIQIK